MNFMTRLLISTNKKNNNYNFISFIINQFSKKIYYEPIKVTIDALKLVEVILNIVV